MLDRGPWWTALGRLLPREVRERVYEPACYDQLRFSLEGEGSRAALGLYALNVFVQTATRNFPRIWHDAGKLSGMGRLAVGMSLTVLGFCLLLVVTYVGAY